MHNDNKLSSIKLNGWSVETRAPWERNEGVGEGGGVRGSDYCKNPDVPNRHDGQSRSDSAPAAGRGREKE